VSRSWKAISLGAGLLLLAGILLNISCSSSGSTRFRFMNAMPDQNSLDVLLNATATTTPTFSNVAYATATAYQSGPSGSQQIELEPSGTSAVIGSAQPVDITSGDNTVIAFNFTPVFKIMDFSDNNSTPATNDFNIRFIDASPALGTSGPAVDIYIETPPGTAINNLSPTVSGLSFQSASSYVALAGGNWEVTVTAKGQKFPAFPSTGSLTFTAGQVRTFVILNSQGGGETYSMLSDLN
jgi:hypothetical protein